MIAAGIAMRDLISPAFWLVAGTAIGISYFLALRWNVAMLAGGRALLPVMVVQFGRLAAIGIVLAVIAVHSGALPLLAASAGILVARAVIVGRGV